MRPAEMLECGVEKKVERSIWARLIKRVYGTDPLIGNRCGAKMRILAVIIDPGETEKIPKAFWLKSIGSFPILTRLL